MHANTLLTLTSLVSLVVAGHNPAQVAHQRLHRRHPTARHHRRAATDPANLAPGSLTTAEGCTQFYTPVTGEYCYKLVSRFNIDNLAAFYAMNPEIDSECSNLLAGAAYCVSRAAAAAASTTSATAAPAATTTKATVAVVSTKVNAAAAETPDATTTTTPSTTPATTSKAPAATSTASEDDGDWVCDTTTAEAAAVKTTAKAAAPQQTTQKAAQAQVQADAPQATTTTQKAAQATQASNVGSAVSNVVSFMSSIGAKSFPVKNGPAIGSWYDASSSQDSTNGHSWCYFPYNDDTPGIAISYKSMMGDGNWSNEEAGKIYCGLEVLVTAPNGNSATLVVADAFDDNWIREPGSIDIMHGAFTKLFGSYTTNKNDVINGVTWQFTGKRNDQYKFNGAGN